MAKPSNGLTSKVSVLVPVYNVEKFLPDCLESLVGQTLKEIEIICINDGSTDGSLGILREYAKLDKRLKIINKKNSGYGDSMNQGLSGASGEYIGIVEPDDFIDLDAFEKMYKVAKRKRADVVKANFYNFETKRNKDVSKSHLFLEDEVGRVIDPRQSRHIFFQQPSVWSAIYERDFLRKNKILFLPSPGASYQDAGFTFKIWGMARRVVFLKEAFLHYRNDNPSSSVKSVGKMYAVKDEYDDVEKYLNERGLMEEMAPTLAAVRLGGYIWNMRRLGRSEAIEFAKCVKEDYERYKRMGYLDNRNFDDKNALYIVNNVIVRNPRLYLDLRPIFELWDGFKIIGLRLYKKVFGK